MVKELTKQRKERHSRRYRQIRVCKQYLFLDDTHLDVLDQFII